MGTLSTLSMGTPSYKEATVERTPGLEGHATPGTSSRLAAFVQSARGWFTPAETRCCPVDAVEGVDRSGPNGECHHRAAGALYARQWAEPVAPGRRNLAWVLSARYW